MSGCSSLARSSSSLPMAVVEVVSDLWSMTMESDRWWWSSFIRMLSWDPLSCIEDPEVKNKFFVFLKFILLINFMLHNKNTFYFYIIYDRSIRKVCLTNFFTIPPLSMLLCLLLLLSLFLFSERQICDVVVKNKSLMSLFLLMSLLLLLLIILVLLFINIQLMLLLFKMLILLLL